MKKQYLAMACREIWGMHRSKKGGLASLTERFHKDLHEGLCSAISSLQAYHKQVAGLEEVIIGLREQVNTLQ